MTKRKALGSGLDSLLSSSQQSYKQDRDAELSTPNSIPVHKIIRNRYQPRKTFDQTELEELAEKELKKRRGYNMGGLVAMLKSFK